MERSGVTRVYPSVTTSRTSRGTEDTYQITGRGLQRRRSTQKGKGGGILVQDGKKFRIKFTVGEIPHSRR